MNAPLLLSVVAVVTVALAGVTGCPSSDPDPSESGAAASSGDATGAGSGAPAAPTTEASEPETSATAPAPGDDAGTTGPATEDSTSTAAPPATTEGDACANGALDGDETDVDCGGSCPACPRGSACAEGDDCADGACESGSCVGPVAGCDVAQVERDPGNNWSDSYSVDGRCYCDSTFDHAIGDIEVETPDGLKTVREVCDAIGPGPGADGHPVYNDIQCGNGPANNAGDEDWCPGRVDQGREGCCTAGPTWDLSVFE